MTGSHIEHDTPHEHAEAAPAAGSDHDEAHSHPSDTVMATVATVGAVGVAAVVFEAALIPGMVLGVAAALAPSYVPRLGAAFNPLLRSGMRGAMKFGQKTREMMHEAREHMNDIAAEVAAEGETAASGLKPKPKVNNGAA